MTKEKSNLRWVKVFDSKQEAFEAVPLQKIIKQFAEGKWICMSRNNERFFAFDETCPHEGASLLPGECTDDGEVICPRHRFCFDLSTGRGEGYYLKVYPVELRSDGLYIGFKKSKWGF